MSGLLRLGIAGLGTVGGGVVRLLHAHGDRLAERTGRRIVVAAVSARDRGRDRGLPLDGARWFDDPAAMAADPDIDVVVELIGGEATARDVVETALRAGKPVVTANKALLAHHGWALARLAEARRLPLSFEAAVAGGIPIVKALREGLAGNAIEGFAGILNGTSNYILTSMSQTGASFAQALAQAQALGYAEADPTFDVEGVDAAHKLSLLASVAFGAVVDFAAVHVEGISGITAADITFARELGFKIKLVGVAASGADGLAVRVHPAMIAEGGPLAHVDGVFNAVVVKGDFVDQIVFEGRGAGEGPTASAVVADLVDIANGLYLPVFGVPADRLRQTALVPIGDRLGPYCLRFSVIDRPGVIADIAAVLRDEQVSIESLLQRGRAPGEAVPVVIVTHAARERSVVSALGKIGELESVVEPPSMIRIEEISRH